MWNYAKILNLSFIWNMYAERISFNETKMNENSFSDCSSDTDFVQKEINWLLQYNMHGQEVFVAYNFLFFSHFTPYFVMQINVLTIILVLIKRY